MAWSPTEVGGVVAIAYVAVKEIASLARSAIQKKNGSAPIGPPPSNKVTPEDASAFWQLQTGMDAKLNRLIEMHVTLTGLIQSVVQQNASLVTSIQDLVRAMLTDRRPAA